MDLRGAMMDRLLNLNVKVLANPLNQTKISRIAVVEAVDTVEIQRFAAQSPEYEVVDDLPISLIKPHRGARTDTAATGLDTWHLDKVFAVERRSNGGEGIAVAVLDTGVTEVDEIRGKIKGHHESDLNTWSVNSATPGDTDGHGTHVSRLVCGDNIGVAPGARVESVTMIPGGRGNLSHFVLAMERVRDNPDIAIMNMSAGIRGYWDGMRDIIEQLESAGVLMIIATGNEGANRSRSPGNYVEPLSIGASTKDDRIAAFSSGGSMLTDGMSYTVPDLVAPGQDVTSCVMNGGYEAWDGTSMATPIVSGIAALHIESDPGILLTELKENIILTCRDLNLPATRQGAGLIQVT